MADDLFTTPNAQPNPTDQTPSADPNQSAFDRLVGEGKKFATPEDLAKGKEESDAFVQKLIDENKVMRDEMQQRLTLEELIDKVTKASTPGSSTPPEKSESEKGEQVTPTEQPSQQVDIEALVKAQLDKERQASQEASNFEASREILIKAWGEQQFPYKLADRAKELGVSKEYLNKLATESPALFAAALGINPQPQTTASPVTPPESSVGNPGVSNPGSTPSGAKSNSYDSKLLKDDPKLYFRKETQLQMHKDAMALGEKFYS